MKKEVSWSNAIATLFIISLFLWLYWEHKITLFECLVLVSLKDIRNKME